MNITERETKIKKLEQQIKQERIKLKNVKDKINAERNLEVLKLIFDKNIPNSNEQLKALKKILNEPLGENGITIKNIINSCLVKK